MQQKRFAKNDEGFICANCGKEVVPLGYSSRNHCPFCLWSLHLDINPGDRASECGGLMRPSAVTSHPKKGFVILYKCKKCGETVRNKAALTGIQPDDTDLLIRLTAKSSEEF